MSDAWHGVEEYVRGWGGVVLPWEQVVRMRFDLALAASFQEIHRVPAPVLVSPHGVGMVKSRLSPWDGVQEGVRAASGLDRELLVRDGRVVPAAVLLTHDAELDRLREVCPEAVPRAAVVGDPCYDRLVASLPFRARYRHALGVRGGRTLVVVSSTWSRHSLLGGEPEFFARVAAELPADRFRVVTALHPNIWSLHGSWQVRSWLADYLDAGHALLPPEEGWRAAVVAADAVIGDHGSVTVYAAALGVPVLMNSASVHDESPGSLTALLRDLSHRLDGTRPVDRQVCDAIAAHQPDRYAGVAARITSQPDQAATLVRRTIYSLLRMEEPEWKAPVSGPVPLPVPITRWNDGLDQAC
ncbi:hypothetical protein [Umezawaea sp. Da 62-37]|uniref:hypothetical protein n=1 Tax=Umezawaea sp. Da 62-37 TaxID=3075927 RepID=UPI0028F6FF4B|nr:hypothetical protein [Umezawaea sp. Da 62-37]WNV88940.1 hypothetical protein RM788_11740 [Umezawaea sp. Da 62-37]